MAETLGSLVDKLSIKNLRIWHLEEALEKDENTVIMEDEFREYDEWDSLAYLSNFF